MDPSTRAPDVHPSVVELVSYGDLQPIARCFVLGAGASYDAGVPVERYILEAAKRSAEHLRTQPARSDYEESVLSRIDQVLGVASAMNAGNLNTSLDPVYSQLDDPGRVALDQLVVFVLSRVRKVGDHFVYHDGPDGPSYSRFADILNPSDVIITFNYDTCLEDGICRRWKVHYGEEIAPYPEQQRYPEKDKDKGRTMRVLRIHGSAGWLTCPRCGYTEDFGSMNINELGVSDESVRQPDSDAYCPACLRQIGVSSWGEESLREHGSRDLYRMFERQHCMILPAAKREYGRPPLKRIWQLSEDALAQCSEIAIIGYSLPPVDTAFIHMTRRAMARRAGRPRVTVVDPSGPTGDAWKNISGTLADLTPELNAMTFSAWLDRQATGVTS